MRRVLLGLLVFCITASAAIVFTPVWLAGGPAAEDPTHHVVHGHVEAREERPPQGTRLVPLTVIEFRIDQVVRQGSGPAPEGRVEVAVEPYSPGGESLHVGAVASLLIHERPALDAEYVLLDARAGCCWASQVDAVVGLWPIWAVALMAAIVAAIDPRAPPVAGRVFAVTAGLVVGALAAQATIGSGLLFVADGEGHVDTMDATWVLLAVAILSAPTAAWVAGRSPWVGVVAAAAAFPWFGTLDPDGTEAMIYWLPVLALCAFARLRSRLADAVTATFWAAAFGLSLWVAGRSDRIDPNAWWATFAALSLPLLLLTPVAPLWERAIGRPPRAPEPT